MVELAVTMILVGTIVCVGASDIFWKSRYPKPRTVIFHISNFVVCIGTFLLIASMLVG